MVTLPIFPTQPFACISDSPICNRMKKVMILRGTWKSLIKVRKNSRYLTTREHANFIERCTSFDAVPIAIGILPSSLRL